MNDKKEAVKKEVINNIKVIFSLCITLLLINNNISIANLIKIIDNERIKWTLDFGIYNAILSSIFTWIIFKLNQKKLYIDLKIISKDDGSNIIKLDGNPKEINIKLKLRGSKPKKFNKVEVIFPYWVDFQIKPKRFIQTDEKNNRCYIDIEYLINNRKELNFTEEISVDLISNTDEKNEDIIQSVINNNIIDKLINTNFTNTDITIKNG